MTDVCCPEGKGSGTGGDSGALTLAAKSMEEGAASLKALGLPAASQNMKNLIPEAASSGADGQPGTGLPMGLSMEALQPFMDRLLTSLFPTLDAGIKSLFAMMTEQSGLGDASGTDDILGTGAPGLGGVGLGGADQVSAVSAEEQGVENEPRVVREREVATAITEIREKMDAGAQKSSEDRASTEKQSMDNMLGTASSTLGALAGKHKAFAIGQVTIDTARAIAKASASAPFPANLLPIAKATAIGASQLSAVKGQFHDGITNVPSTGSYILERGERVVDSRLNQDLKAFLNGAGSGPQSLQSNQSFAPQITVQGNADEATVDRLEQMMRDVYAERLSTEFS